MAAGYVNHFTVIPAIDLKEGKVVRLLDYAPDQPLREVPDPYYTGKFDQTYALVSEGCLGLLTAIRRDHP